MGCINQPWVTTDHFQRFCCRNCQSSITVPICVEKFSVSWWATPCPSACVLCVCVCDPRHNAAKTDETYSLYVPYIKAILCPSFQILRQAMLGGREFFECPQDIPGRRPGVAQWIYPAVPLLPMIWIGRFLTELPLNSIITIHVEVMEWSWSFSCLNVVMDYHASLAHTFQVWIQFISLRCGRSIRMYGHRGLVCDFIRWPRQRTLIF